MKAMGYIRVSTEEQAKEGISLDNQIERIKGYCQYKNFELAEML
jgi:site-specific DNA recombinase